MKKLLFYLTILLISGAGCANKTNQKSYHVTKDVLLTDTTTIPTYNSNVNTSTANVSTPGSPSTAVKETKTEPSSPESWTAPTKKPISLVTDPATGVQYDENSETGPSQKIDPNCPPGYQYPGVHCAVIDEKNNTATLRGITCPNNYDPVCASGGHTLLNACSMQYYSKETILHKGICTPEEIEKIRGTQP